MDPEKEVIFIDGMRWWKPSENAPDFVKGRISIDPVKLVAFLRANKKHMNDKGYFSADVKVARTSGDWYIQLNTWKPKKEEPALTPHEEDVPF